jgi:hypothetical protein
LGWDAQDAHGVGDVLVAAIVKGVVVVAVVRHGCAGVFWAEALADGSSRRQ